MPFDNRTGTAPKIETKKRNIKKPNFGIYNKSNAVSYKNRPNNQPNNDGQKEIRTVCLSVLCFNKPGNGLDGMEVRWVKQCRRANIARRLFFILAPLGRMD